MHINFGVLILDQFKDVEDDQISKNKKQEDLFKFRLSNIPHY